MDENNERHIEVTHLTFTFEEDAPDPPPPGLKSSFNTVCEWLMGICDGNIPNKPIDTYRVGLFESADNYTIFLIGQNTTQHQRHSVTNTEFEPSSMYFQLPDNEFQNLNRQALLDKLIFQLKTFTDTEEFKKSFLAQAKSIVTDFGTELWSNEPNSLNK